MLFNSFEFVFLFLPITLTVFFYLGSKPEYVKGQLPILWLIIASLIFYGAWKPSNLLLIILSIGVNYYLGYCLSNSLAKPWVKKGLFTLGIIFNLGLISCFKYSNFLLGNINQAIGTNFDLPLIVIPLAISFFTFQQIAYLVDAYRGETKEYDLRKYMLFVCFFPQLIAGPIVHHKEVLPQFEKASIYKFSQKTLAIGLTVFIAGLFKKVIFADRIAEYSNMAFAAASQGINLTFSEAWVGALGYSLQLYFDFSIPSTVTKNSDNTFDGSHFSVEINNKIAHILQGEDDSFGIRVDNYNFGDYREKYRHELQGFLAESQELERWDDNSELSIEMVN